MARPLRLEFEDAVYHIAARGNRRERIFTSDGDRAQFLTLLSRSLRRYEGQVHAYVLLGNHFHLLVGTPRANLSRWMHWLMVSYTVYFNRKHRKAGHLFQGRYQSLLVESGEYLLEASRYLHLNPVRGRLLGAGDPKERRGRLRGYRWSSFPGYAGLAEPAAFVTEDLVLDEFAGPRVRDRRLRYRRFVEEGLTRELTNPADAAHWQSVLGSEGFLQQMKDKMQLHRPKRREVKALRRGTNGPDPGKIIEQVAAHYRVDSERLLRGKQYGLEARNIALWVVRQKTELTLREIGTLFGGMDYAAVAQRIRRVEADAAQRIALNKLLEKY